MNRGLAVLIAVASTVVAIALLLAFISYQPDQIQGASPTGSNLLGPAGAWIAYHVISSWGLAAVLLPIALAGLGWSLTARDGYTHLPRRATALILLLPILSGLVHLLPETGFQNLLLRWDMQRLHGLGGNFGWMLVGPVAPPEQPEFAGGILRRYLDQGGSLLVLILAALGCLALVQLHILAGMQRAWRAARNYRNGRDGARSDRNDRSDRGGSRTASAVVTPRPARGEARPPGRVTSGMDLRRASTPVVPSAQPPQRAATNMQDLVRRIQDDEAVPPDAADLVERIRRRREALASGDSVAAAPAAPAAPSQTPEPVVSSSAHSSPAALSETDIQPVRSERANVPPEPSRAPLPSAAAPLPKPQPRPKPRKQDADSGGYNLPPVELLDNVPLRDDAKHEQEKNSTAQAIESTFANFGIKVSVVAASRGPVITMYEIELGDAGMRVGKVEGFEKDLALKLGTEGIRIVAPLPNKKTIGIEVPNRVKEAVVMRDLVEQTDASQMILPLILGRDVVGNPMLGDLAKMPHLLVAGATGTGKSVCMNAMICSILLFRGPNEVKFIMVDPKMVELAGYEDIPHLLTPPITDMTKAHAALEWACRCMDERYFALRLVGVRDLKAYNELGEAEIRNRLARKGKTLEDLPGIEVRMPLIVVLVDEYADLMMVNKEVEKSIIRLTQKSRAAGIHVILTTQRPSADVVTGLIKSNLPARICFRVADKSNSRVVLDSGGAENLLGRGDLLYLPPGSNALVRGQGVWVKDSEIEAIIEHAKSQGRPQYDENICSAGAVAMVSGGGNGTGSEWVSDRGFHEAVQSMYRYNRSGADFFRRKLNIGYNKATSYVEQLEDLGFLGPQKGTSAREVLRSWDDWVELLKAQGHTWDEEDELYHDPNAMGGIGRE